MEVCTGGVQVIGPQNFLSFTVRGEKNLVVVEGGVGGNEVGERTGGQEPPSVKSPT